MSKFSSIFSEPNCLSDGSHALSAEAYPTREEAAAIFSDYLERPVDPAALEEDRMRFHPAGEEDCGGGDFEPGQRAWFSGASGRGSKPVWLLPPRRK